jgi:hypothetical protein
MRPGQSIEAAFPFAPMFSSTSVLPNGSDSNTPLIIAGIATSTGVRFIAGTAMACRIAWLDSRLRGNDEKKTGMTEQNGDDGACRNDPKPACRKA